MAAFKGGQLVRSQIPPNTIRSLPPRRGDSTQGHCIERPSVVFARGLRESNCGRGAMPVAPNTMSWRAARLPALSLIGCITAFAPVAIAVTPSDTTSATAQAVRLDPPPRSFSLIATGDVLTEALVTFAAAGFGASTGARYNFAPLFAPVTGMLSSADIAICHMEMPIGAPGDRPGVYGHSPFGGNLILAPYEIADGLRRAGFDRCSTASNHSNDLAEYGIDTTLAALDASGLTHVGTARSPAEAGIEAIVVNSVRLVHLAYTRYSNTVLPTEPWHVDFCGISGAGSRRCQRRAQCRCRRRGRQSAPLEGTDVDSGPRRSTVRRRSHQPGPHRPGRRTRTACDSTCGAGQRNMGVLERWQFHLGNGHVSRQVQRPTYT